MPASDPDSGLGAGARPRGASSPAPLVTELAHDGDPAAIEAARS